jgi:hypothetical protein
MDYPIPANTEEILALRRTSVDEEIIATAIAGVVRIARQEGQTLEDLIAGVLQDDRLLDLDRRRWLSELVAQAWSLLP